MFLIRHVVRPLSSHPECNSIGGAYSNIYVNSSDKKNAVNRALEIINLDNWEAVENEGIQQLNDKDINDLGEDVIQQFNDHGIAVVFHTWPKEADDDREV